MRRQAAPRFWAFSGLVWLAVSAAAGDKVDPLDVLVDRYYAAQRSPEGAGRNDIYDPAFLLAWRYAEDGGAAAEDDFADWTILGREPTWRDLQAIAENLRKLGKADVGKGGGIGDDEKEDGAVIINLVEAATAAGGVFGHAAAAYDAWPGLHDEDAISWCAPDGAIHWYSAPWPWVIHERQPFIGLWTPSPYYDNPWIFTMVEGDDGQMVYTWRNIWPRGYVLPFSLAPAASTHLGLTFDSAAGWHGGIELWRPWGEIVWQGGSAKPAANSSHERRLQISLDFHGVSRLPLATALGSGWLTAGRPTTAIRRSPAESSTARGFVNANAPRGWHRIGAQPAPNYWLGKAVASGAVRTVTSGDDLIFLDMGLQRVVIQGERVIDLAHPPPADTTFLLQSNEAGKRLIYLPADGSPPRVGRGIIILSR